MNLLTEKFHTGPIKQRRRYRTLFATSLALAANTGISLFNSKSRWAWPPLHWAVAHVVGNTLADLEEFEGKGRHFTELTESVGANIALSAGWSVLSSKSPYASLVSAALLTGSTVDLLQRCREVDPHRANLLTPYLAWLQLVIIKECWTILRKATA